MIVDETVLFCAFRYAIGRKTYVVSSVVDSILTNWDSISLASKELFVKEIHEYYEEGNLGHQCDIECWNKILKRFNIEASASV
jgi:hypothetical protein